VEALPEAEPFTLASICSPPRKALIISPMIEARALAEKELEAFSMRARHALTRD
jgi:hypothetical protein